MDATAAKMPERPLPKKTLPRGFSLTEVVLSLGIFAGALSVVALFPILLGQSKKSGQETRAALVARQIINDLTSVTGTSRPLVDAATLPQNVSGRQMIDLNTSAIHVVHYNQEGLPVPSTSVDATMKAEISVVPPDTAHPGLSQLAIRICGLDEGPTPRYATFYTKLSQMSTALAPQTTPPVASTP